MTKLKDFETGLLFLIWVFLFEGSQIATIRYANLGVISVCVILMIYLKWKREEKWRWSAGLTVFASFGLVRWLWLEKTPIAEFGGLDKTNTTIFFLLVAILAVQYLDDWTKGRGWENALIGLTFLIALFELLLAYLWLRNWWAVSGEWYSWPPIGYRMKGILLVHPNITSGFLNLSIPLVVARLLANKSLRRKLMWGGIMLLLAIVQFFTSSRTGWVSAAAGIGVTTILIMVPDIFDTDLLMRLKRVFKVRNLVITGVGLAFLAAAFGLIISQAGITPGHGGRLDIWSYSVEIWSGDWILGMGTFSFPILYSQIIQAPPGFIAPHAHNLILEFGAEYGLIGLGILTAALFVGISMWWNAWKGSTSEGREALAAYAGVGTAVWLHHLGDHFVDINIYNAGLIIVFVNVSLRTPLRDKALRTSLFSIALVVGILGMAAVGTYKAAKGLEDYHLGIEASKGNEWDKAAKFICEAADSIPQVSFYQFECAIALAYQGNSTNQDREWLDEAIEIMKRGIERDPYWPLHWAFLAELQWRSGDLEGALVNIQRASESAPRNAEIALRWGWMLEMAGKDESAAEVYNQALEINEWYSVIQNSSGSQLFDEVRSQHYVFEEVGHPQYTVVDGYRYLIEEEFEKAEAILREEIERSFLNAEAHALLGLEYIYRGQAEEGWLEVQTALLIRQSPMILSWAAEAALMRGDNELAAEYLWRAFEQMSLISNDSKRYYDGVYHRSYLTYERAPWVSKGDLLPEMVDSMEWLADFFTEKGDLEKGEEILSWLETSGWQLSPGQ